MTVEIFLQQVVTAVAAGLVYASLALGIVVIHRASGVTNLAQGEMAMFSTFIAWQLWSWGTTLVVAVVGAIVLSMVASMAIERTLIRPSLSGSPLTPLIVSVGVLLLLNQLAAFIWTTQIRSFPSLFPEGMLDVLGVRVSYNSIGTMVTVALAVAVLAAMFNLTRIGLAMRAVAGSRAEAPLVGIKVGRVLSLGWALGAALGALAGVLVAPVAYLDNNMMMPVLVYGLAAAMLGGLDSMPGAVIGGLIVGVAENLAGTYIDVLGPDLKVLVPLAIIVVVLLVRPAGLLGREEVVRV